MLAPRWPLDLAPGDAELNPFAKMRKNVSLEVCQTKRISTVNAALAIRAIGNFFHDFYLRPNFDLQNAIGNQIQTRQTPGTYGT